MLRLKQLNFLCKGLADRFEIYLRELENTGTNIISFRYTEDIKNSVDKKHYTYAKFRDDFVILLYSYRTTKYNILTGNIVNIFDDSKLVDVNIESNCIQFVSNLDNAMNIYAEEYVNTFSKYEENRTYFIDSDVSTKFLSKNI